jgi:hypothetical protein
MSSFEGFTFVCRACTHSTTVNVPMRDALVENGCVVCGTSVTETAFTPDAA